ncbi:hypothetical protein [Sphaerotilus natans]|nr:hypothetical protein [Sphaerotilus natans]
MLTACSVEQQFDRVTVAAADHECCGIRLHGDILVRQVQGAGDQMINIGKIHHFRASELLFQLRSKQTFPGALGRHENHGSFHHITFRRLVMSEFRHVFLPYCLERQADGRWAVLNRKYKPVGMHTSAYVKYEDPYLIRFKSPLTSATLQALCAPGSEWSETKVWLYNDGCIPTDSAAHWTAYQKRLERLANLQIV